MSTDKKDLAIGTKVKLLSPVAFPAKSWIVLLPAGEVGTVIRGSFHVDTNAWVSECTIKFNDDEIMIPLYSIGLREGIDFVRVEEWTDIPNAE